MSAITGWFLANFDNISSLVEYCPLFVFFGFEIIFKSSNKTSPNCFGEARLNSLPQNSKILFSLSFKEIKNLFSISFNRFSLRLTPSSSILVKTNPNGISKSWNNLLNSSFSISVEIFSESIWITLAFLTESLKDIE